MHKPTLSDLDWLRSAIQAEELYGGDIQIGGRPPIQQQIDPTKLQQGRALLKLYSLLYGELGRLLDEVDFGSGAEAAYTRGRQCIYERMQTLAPDHKVSLDTLASAAATLPSPELQIQLRQQLYRLLTSADWQSIVAVALGAVETKLLQQVASA